MRKEIIKCDLCDVEIALGGVFYYTLSRTLLPTLGAHDGPDHMDICRYCIQDLLDPLGKWPELESELGQDEEAVLVDSVDFSEDGPDKGN
jgi:hypothetical protein